MRKLMNRLMGISLLSLLLIAGTGQRANAQDVVVSYQTFYDNLSPYGQWVYDPDYGNVWVPNEGGDFRPYGSRGNWVMTDYGNTWVSEDPWGWACYHYGRWTYDSYYGWVWIPGYEWAPAWVSWRYGGGYCGWAPMGPGVNVGMSYSYPDSWWIFIAPRYMYTPNCYSYWRGPSYNNTYIRQTTIVNNYYVDNSTHVRYNYGPRRDVIEQDTHQPVEVRRISRTNRPGAPNVNGNRVNMYRPEVNRSNSSNARPSNVMEAPQRIGRPQQDANVTSSHQVPFRQEVQRQNPGTRNNDQRQPGQATQPGNRQNTDQRQPDRGQRSEQPQRNEPARQQPQRSEPTRQQPQRSEPARQQPQRSEPARQQPQRSEPARQQPQRSEPARQQPQRSEPARQQPQRSEPARTQPPAPQRSYQAPPRQQQQAPQPQRQAPQQRSQPAPAQRQQTRPQPQTQQRPAPSGGREQGGRK